MSEYSKTVIAWGTLNEALVYFEHVVPFDRPHIFWRMESVEDFESFKRAFHKDLLPPEFRNEAFEYFNDSLDLALLAVLASPDDNKRSREYKEIQRSVTAFFNTFPVLKTFPLIPPDCEKDAKQGGDIAVAISSISLIDPSSIPLRHLLEFREDKETMVKLRRFRLFAYNNYTGKSRDFIEDDILTRLADYEQAAKKWGFTTVTGAINILLNSTLIAGGIAGSFLSAYYKAPIEAIVSTMSATGVAIANMAVNLGQQRFAQKELLANNPVSYISYMKDKLEGK